jgi:hypothetical protein
LLIKITFCSNVDDALRFLIRVLLYINIWIGFTTGAGDGLTHG